MDKFSYSIGLGIGQNLSSMGIGNLAVDDFAQAIKDVLEGNQTAISHNEAREIVNKYFEELETKMGAGVDVVIIPNKNSAKISSDALKTSAGALYHVPVCRVLNLKRVVRELKFQRGIRVYAATEKAEKFYTGADLTLPTAIIMGSEDKGIDEELINIATDCIKIPQKGQIESLNVSAAAAVLLFEVVRQRG